MALRMAKRGVDANIKAELTEDIEDVKDELAEDIEDVKDELAEDIEDIVDGTTGVGDAILARAATIAHGVAHGSGENILIATLTTAFGDPATLADGSLFTYANTTDSKVYVVIVVNDAFYLQEMTAAAAE